MLAFRPVDQRPIDAPPVQPSEISRPVVTDPAVSEPAPQPAIETPVVEKPLEAPATPATVAQPESAPVNDPPPWEDIPAEAYADQEPTAKKFEADSVEAVSAPLESARVELTEPSQPFKPAEPMDQPMEEPTTDPVESNDSAIDLFGEETPLATYDKPDEQSVVEEVNPVEPIEQIEQAKKTAEKSITLSNVALEDWVHLIAQLNLTGMTESLAKAMSLETLQGNRMVLHYTAEQEALFNDQHKQRIADAITAFFQEPMSVDFQLAEQTRETPVNYRIRRAEERRIAAVRHLKQDPNVERLIEMFDGQLDELSVEPLEIE
jgi:DNA polymerase-3 subunit gamma/tau